MSFKLVVNAATWFWDTTCTVLAISTYLAIAGIVFGVVGGIGVLVGGWILGVCP